ncbi:hypothetical protein [Sphingomonas sp. VNH70]|uniref:hypothetical protein n=1 Tax=Sphingomonas silueang TaxID=3156617 RepID=UPI0032B4981B
MHTGLIFATEEAERQSGVLAATLPFGGMTLIEYQARLLAKAGAGQLLVVVARVTPALAAAVNRIGRRGLTVDIVRSAEEALAKAHPQAVIIALADALVTTEAVVSGMAREPADTLLVTPTGDTAAVERVDAAHCWAGVATLSIDRLAEAARLPREYDFQSSLLRVATQARPAHVLLAAGAVRSGHGVERDAGTLEVRGRDLLASLARTRTGWIDRFVLGPLGRLLLPSLVRHRVPDTAVVATGAALGLGALAAIPLWSAGAAALLCCLALVLLSTGGLLARLRGEDGHARVAGHGIAATGFATLFGVALVQSLVVETGTAVTLGITAVVATVVAQRAAVRALPWGASAATAPVLLLPFAAAGQVTVGLVLVALHAAATLVATIETARRA